MTDSTAPALPRTGGNENTGFLKLLAIVFMVIDHVGVAFFPQCRELRFFGRAAFPLFAWCLVVGACYTRNIWKYALRLLLGGALFQPFYMYGMNHQWQELNILFELLLGLLAIAAIRENRYGSKYWGPALAILISCVLSLNASYGWKGILFILVLYAFRSSRTALALGMTVFCLFWGQGTMMLTNLFGLALPQKVSWLPYSGTLLSDLFRIQFWAILALPLILLPMKSRLKLPKWAAYGFYPFHLLVIGVIRHWDELTAFLSR